MGGAGDAAHARHAAAQGLNLAVVIGIVVAIAGWFAAPLQFAALGTTPEVAALGSTYLRVMCLGAPATFVYQCAAAIMRAAGNTRAPMVIMTAALAANIALAPLLIYNAGWGIAGAGIATVMCQTLAVGAFAWLAAQRETSLPVAIERLGRPDLRLMADILRIGFPYFVMIFSFSLVYLFYDSFAAHAGPKAMAVVGVANRLESLCYLPADGFAAAAAAFVGQNLGAKRPDRASRGAWGAVAVMAALAAVISVLFFVAPRPFLSLFSDDPEVLALGAPYLRVLSLCLVATGIEGVLVGAFAGSGATMPVLIVHGVFSAIRIPIAWLVSVRWGYGIMGIAWTITVTCTVRALVLALWFQRGAWMRSELGGKPKGAQEQAV
jgi:putative MATE family efflux protein